MDVLQMLVALAVVVALIVLANRLGTRKQRKRTAMGPHATFDGGGRYATETERTRVELDGPGNAGEGLLMALVDALRARGAGTNPVEPEAYGFMTVVEIDGEDVILELGAGTEQDWLLFVKAPSGKVPHQVMDALRSLADIRNVTWFV